MKRLWDIMSFLAVVHLLALALFAGWLWQSGRLDSARLRQLRDLLAMTVEEAETQALEAQAEAEAQRLAAEEDSRRENPPLPSAAHVQHVATLQDQTAQALRRLQDETEQLLARVQLREAQLAKRQTDFQQRQQAWEESIAADVQRRTDEQFQKAVRQYEAAPPKIARQWMLELVKAGEEDQVVAYLDAMNPRAASKILREFKLADDATLATELLERLRTFGLEAAGAEDASHDSRFADAE